MKPAIVLLGVAILFGIAQAQDKVQDRNLLRRSNTNVIVTLTQSLAPVYRRVSSARYSTRSARIQAVRRNLRTATRRYHEPILRGLERFGVDATSFWITNRISIRGANPRVISYLSTQPTVAMIEEDTGIEMDPERVNRPAQAPRGNAWGVDRIRSPEVWETTRGEGVVVAVIDTGVRGTHEALRDNFAGIEENGWYDPIWNSTEPIDEDGHGTHCTGSAVGGMGVGVAPGAQWIACRACANDPNLGRTTCPRSAIIKCGEWATCPHDGNPDNADCDKAPHVISNSYGGGQGNTYHNDLTLAWENAGIFHTFSIGNNGPACGTAGSPGDQEVSFSVGATSENDRVWNKSSRGPAVNTGIIKPNIVAPGDLIQSAHHESDDDYAYYSGTSQATPHVAGAGALIIAGREGITPEEIRQAMIDTTFQDLLPSNQTCGGIPEGQYPNNIAGWGLLDVKAAFDQATA